MKKNTHEVTKTTTAKGKKAADTLIVIGPYRIPLSRERFLSWEADLMTGAGFTNREINAEILRRLGICEK